MKLEIDRDGNRLWYNDEGELHRENGPAFEGTNGVKWWFRDGVEYRDNGPVFDFGDQSFYSKNEFENRKNSK